MESKEESQPTETDPRTIQVLAWAAKGFQNNYRLLENLEGKKKQKWPKQWRILPEDENARKGIDCKPQTWKYSICN